MFYLLENSHNALELKDLNNNQRRDLIKQLIPNTWEEVSIQIEDDNSLSQVTKTPLFLIELINIYKDNGTLPRTKVEIFEQVIRRIEHESEHSEWLQSSPMSGRSESYLVQLSIYATRLCRVAIKNNDACRVIVTANNQLQLSGQLQTKPEPADIINLLCDQHILVRSEEAIRFVHQQFQEYYAYLFIKERLQEIIADLDDDKIVEFQEDIINYPIWEESLILLAEEIADKLEMSSDEDVLKFGEYLVRWTITIDPLFAAKLVNVLGTNVWNIVKNDFESILKKWYEFADENHKACALAAMFATGTDSFSDIIWPLLEHEDEQIRLTAYRTAKPFMVNCLGDNWQNRINNWNEERRAEFLSELASNYETNVIDILESYAQDDPSPKVRIAAINEIGWYYSASRLHDIISTCDEGIFKIIIKDDYILSKIPEEQIPRAIEAYLQFLKDEDNQNKRIRLLLKMYGLNKSNAIALLKEELESFQPEKKDTFLNDVLKKMACEDPDWVSLWVCQQISKGNLYYDYYSDYITKVPELLIGKLLKDFVKPDYSKQLEYETKKLIAVDATQEHIHLILQEIIRLSVKLKDKTTSISDPDRNIYSRLVDVARLLPLQSLSVVILQHYTKPDSVVLSVILDLLLSYNQDVESGKSLKLEEETSHNLKQLLYNYLDLVLEEDEYHGKLKADILYALALFGKPQDFPLIERLFKRDIEERRSLTGDRRRYARCGLQIRALLKMNSNKVEELLIDLLNEPEYENDAANGLAQLLWKEVPKEKQRIVFHDPLIIGSLKWREEYIDSAKRKKYAQAIVQRINDKRKKDSCCAPKTLARHLAKLNAPDTIPLILEIIAAPRMFDAWDRYHTLETLVRNGHCLDTTIVEDIINPAIEQAVDIRISGKQDMYLLIQCLCILACSNNMARAISIIDKILEKHTLWELRGLIETLGNRKNSDAASYLIHLCQQKRLYNVLCYQLIEALGKTGLPQAKEALLSIIDNSISSPKIPMPNRNGRNSLSTALSNICKSDESVQKRIISVCNEQSVSKEQISIILSVVNGNPSNEAIIAAISMLSIDNDKSSIPYELKSAVEKSVIQHVPVVDIPGGYNILPRINKELSMQLFESVTNKHDNWLFAFKILGYINWLRIEHGRPQLEPRHPDARSQKPWPPLNIDK